MTMRFKADHLYSRTGWISPGYFEVDEHGFFRTVSHSPPEVWAGSTFEHLHGYVFPGMPNVHSHAHQRALAGRTEQISGDGSGGSLWTWRERMYSFVARVSPDDLELIAAQTYIEMLKAGFTTVGEFHYLHHDEHGRPYGDPAEMSERILAAAGEVGIGITLLPVLYTNGGVGRPPLPEQRRFLHEDPDAYLGLVESLARRADSTLRVGIAPHSLRAVDETRLRHVLEWAAEQNGLPIHIHVAERREEVEECVAGLGARPIEWLLDRVGIDERWTLIHATHCSEAERRGMAASGAVVGLCPATEANLGDGLFPLPEYHTDGGSWAVGTDSNTAVSLIDEFRTLELGQRLRHRRRDILTSPGSEATEHPGPALLGHALSSGARSVRHPIGAVESGLRADLVVLEPEHVSLSGHGTETVLDAWIFATTANPVHDVMVAGHWVVRNGHHEREADLLRRLRPVLEALRSGG
jgi:formimidoylglutamate deiminase